MALWAKHAPQLVRRHPRGRMHNEIHGRYSRTELPFAAPECVLRAASWHCGPQKVASAHLEQRPVARLPQTKHSPLSCLAARFAKPSVESIESRLSLSGNHSMNSVMVLPPVSLGRQIHWRFDVSSTSQVCFPWDGDFSSSEQLGVPFRVWPAWGGVVAPGLSEISSKFGYKKRNQIFGRTAAPQLPLSLFLMLWLYRIVRSQEGAAFPLQLSLMMLCLSRTHRALHHRITFCAMHEAFHAMHCIHDSRDHQGHSRC